MRDWETDEEKNQRSLLLWVESAILFAMVACGVLAAAWSGLAWMMS